MTNIYITEQGATVQLRSGRLMVRKADSILQDLPEAQVDQIILFGNIQLTTQVIAHCLQNNVDVLFLSASGRYRGRLQGDWSKSVALRHRQYARSLDARFCLAQARAIVLGKVTNLMAFARRQPTPDDRLESLRNLNQITAKIAQAPAVDVLLGLEGAASAAYFAAFTHWVPAPWQFTKRIAHPPPDPVNALLSLGYTLLYSRTIAAIHVVGLDPYLGFFHAQRHGHACLASDLMEEFRPLIVDGLVLKLLKRHWLRPESFSRSEPGMKLQPEALALFLKAFEERLADAILYEPEGVRLTYAHIIERQVRHFARVLIGDDPAYRPFVVK